MHFLKIKGLLNALSLVGVRIIVASSVFLGTALVTFGGYSIYEQMYTQNRAFESGIQAFDSTEQIEEAQKSLVEEREDYRAWLRVEGTAIDYPVMQGVNDLYYAKHDVDKNISISGAIYMSTENAADFSDNYIVIYGHHMDNGAMFGDIDRYLPGKPSGRRDRDARRNVRCAFLRAAPHGGVRGYRLQCRQKKS